MHKSSHDNTTWLWIIQLKMAMTAVPDSSPMNGFTRPPGISYTSWFPCHCSTNVQIGYRFYNGTIHREKIKKNCSCAFTTPTTANTSPKQTTEPPSATTRIPIFTPGTGLTRKPILVTTPVHPSERIDTTTSDKRPTSTGTTLVGPITPSLAGDTDKAAIIIGGVLGGVVAILIIVILVIVLICRRKARSDNDDKLKDCFDFCRTDKESDSMNEPTYNPPEDLRRPPGLTAVNNREPTYIDRDDSTVDYGYPVYETLPSESYGPVLISRPSESSTPATGMPMGTATTDSRTDYDQLANSHRLARNNPLPSSPDPGMNNRSALYDHSTGPPNLARNNAYNHLSPAYVRPNTYTGVFPEYLELEDSGVVSPSAPPDSLEGHYD